MQIRKILALYCKQSGFTFHSMSANEAERIKVPWRNPCFVWWLQLQVRNAMSSTMTNQRWCFRQKITWPSVFMAVKIMPIEKYFHPMVPKPVLFRPSNHIFSSESGGRSLIPAFKVQSRIRWSLVWETVLDHDTLENMLKKHDAESRDPAVFQKLLFQGDDGHYSILS